MRTFRLSAVIVVAALLAAGSAEASAMQWTSGPGANNHWYWWSFGAETFNSALIFADNVPLDPDGPGGNPPLAGYDSYLVTITSAEEQAFINSHPDNGDFLYWIAASDAAVEGTWRWVAGPETGQLMPPSGPGYSGWCQGEPNDFLGGEDAAVANWCQGGEWNDLSVTSQNRYGIEWALVDAAAIPEPGTLVLLSTGAALFLRSRRRRQAL
jgi:hypothetical protein